MPKPIPAVLEIIERGHASDDPSMAIPVPTEVRINGTPLWCSEHGIKVSAIEVGGDGSSCVLATITLICRRVSIGFEGDL